MTRFPYLVALVTLLATFAVAQTVTVSPTRYDNMYELYQASAKNGGNILITSDSLLHTGHILFDYTLRAAELNAFRDDVLQLCKTTTNEVSTWTDVTQVIPSTAAVRAAALTGVAWKLLDPNAQIPASVSPLVDSEIALITAAKGQSISPILGVTEDYTQYVPRGHYTRNEQFKSYFKAMMWLGRAGFQISGEKSPGVPLTQDECRYNALAGITLSESLLAPTTVPDATAQQGKLTAGDLWQQVYNATGFLVGDADDLTPPEYVKLTTKVFGDTLPTVWNADAQAKTDQFIAEAIKLRPPKILGGIMSDEQKNFPVSLRLMGQRWVPDSEWFQDLVNTAVPGRDMPTGLDVMAVLGSPTAVDLLKAKGEFTNPTYGTQYSAALAALQKQVAAMPDDDWKKTVYLLWLKTLRDLETGAEPFRPANDLESLAYPTWWTDPIWKTKQLNAGLGSWAELRHDTILYVKQSYSVRTMAMPMPEPGTPQVYVEPVPQVYEDLLAMVTVVRQGMEKEKVFPEELSGNYEEFLSLLRSMDEIARQELELPLLPSPAESVTVPRGGGIGDLLQHIETLPEPLKTQLTGTEDNLMALVADVHTDINTKQVLEVGVGKVYCVIVPASINGATVNCTGPIFSYYEFPQPMDNRLTDEAWQAMMKAGKQGNPFVLGK